MRIVQSCWSCNKGDLLNGNAGWAAPEYHLMGWALSCLQLRKYYKDVVLYADSVSAKMLIDDLQLPYSEVVCNLDALNHYNPSLWALPKIHTYSVQEFPFLHVDGDVFIWDNFDRDLLKGKLIAQNMEAATNYYESIMRDLEKSLDFFPDEILADRNIKSSIRAYNAGIFGGSDIEFYREYTLKAFEFVEKNQARLYSINAGNFNIFFEQYLFYCLAQEKGITVSLLFDKVFEDNGYVDFGKFTDVPYSTRYLHLLGTFKRNREICKQMANRLRLDYPEYYYRIISIFKKRKLTLQSDYYDFVKDETADALVKRYYFLKQGGNIKLPFLLNNVNAFSFWRSDLCMSYFESVLAESCPYTVVQQLKDDLRQFEIKADKIITKDFTRIDREVLYQRDVISADFIQSLFKDNDRFEKREIVSNKNFAIFKTNFDWSFLDCFEISLSARIEKVLASHVEENYAIIIPECCREGYSFINGDELDVLMFEELQNPKSIETLIRKISDAFDPEEIKECLAELKLLICGRIKTGLLCKTIMLLA